MLRFNFGSAKLTSSLFLLCSFPVVDVRATLYDGSYHEVDSSVLAFQLAARGAFREGIAKAGPRLLEPIMKVEVVTPEDHLGDVIGDLNSRRGMVSGFGDKPGGMKVSGLVNSGLQLCSAHPSFRLMSTPVAP